MAFSECISFLPEREAQTPGGPERASCLGLGRMGLCWPTAAPWRRLTPPKGSCRCRWPHSCMPHSGASPRTPWRCGGWGVGWGVRQQGVGQCARCGGPSITTRGDEATICALQHFIHPPMPPPHLFLKPTWHSEAGRGCWSRWKTQGVHLWSRSWRHGGATDQEES